ncbi:MAG TPA: hypothetical protein VN661_08280 [Candidatus Acidoferrales bacterium]|nr:hypothetical protein [Candidatus Acidoferrales bacterium]
MPHLLPLVAIHGLQTQFSFPQGMLANEQIALRWIHFVAGITWIGLLYFFNLIGFPAMKEADPRVRAGIFPILMSRAMWWFRWSALVTVLAGLRYFYDILSVDAQNAGNPALAWRWLAGWFVVWIIAYALIYALQLPGGGMLGSGWVRASGIAAIAVAASWSVLRLGTGPHSSNAHLSISIGGGLGLVMLFNAWGVVWRVQKRLIVWTRAAAAQAAPMPAEADRLARWSLMASRTAFWLSFPMLFFMAAAEHYPFLGGMVR